MGTIDGLPTLREVIVAHDLVAKRQLGQNFLLDLNLTAKIARSAGDLAGHDILEVGPGPGGLTRGLLVEGARRVLCVEKDARCIPALEQIAAVYPGRLQIIEGDALEVDAAAHLTAPIKVVANLPYNVGTELLIRWLTPKIWPPFWDSLTLMFQKEVAERIVAKPRGDHYGRLAILAQWRCDAKIVMHLPPEAFTPAPKVHSAVVHLTRLASPRFPADEARVAAADRDGLWPAAQDAAVQPERDGGRYRRTDRGGGVVAHRAGRRNPAGRLLRPGARGCAGLRPGQQKARAGERRGLFHVGQGSWLFGGLARASIGLGRIIGLHLGAGFAGRAGFARLGGCLCCGLFGHGRGHRCCVRLGCLGFRGAFTAVATLAFWPGIFSPGGRGACAASAATGA